MQPLDGKWFIRQSPRNTLECVLFPGSVHEGTTSNSSFRIPKNIFAGLFGYQRDALNWMFRLYLQGKGGILGDEMGLGKTVQVGIYILLPQ